MTDSRCSREEGACTARDGPSHSAHNAQGRYKVAGQGETGKTQHMPTIHAGDIDLHYERKGEGPALL